MTAARTHTVSVDGAPIVLREWGDESALPVVHWIRKFEGVGAVAD